MKNIEDIVAEKIKKFWDEHERVETVVCFFDQKYNHEKEWNHIRVLAEPYQGDWDVVEFEWDFYEGQTEIKNIKIAFLDDILDKYEEEE